MKPVRGSKRAPSKTPNVNVNGRELGEKRHQKKAPLKPGTSNQAKHTKSQRSKAKVPAVAPRKVKGQENWKQMSKTSITALEKMVDLSILSVLSTRRTDKDEVQKHLNIFKKKFLATCTELPVPAQKHGEGVNVSRQLQEEIRKSTESRKTLAKLEEDLGTVVSTLEQMEEETDSLDHECSRLRQQLEQEEKEAQEVLQLTQHEVLNLPPVPPRKDNKPTIQERLLGLVPDTDRGSTARRVGTALQNVSIRNALTLMKHVHKHADHLLTPPNPQTNSSG